MKSINQIQQGDVLLHRVTEEVDFSKGKILPRKNKKVLTLAEGEATGHHHSFVLESEDDAELIQMGEKMLLNLKKDSVLTHQEHKDIVVEKGVWEFGQVVEKDWVSGMVRKVVD